MYFVLQVISIGYDPGSTRPQHLINFRKSKNYKLIKILSQELIYVHSSLKVKQELKSL